jgi:protein-tyrosine-phosphatase
MKPQLNVRAVIHVTIHAAVYSAMIVATFAYQPSAYFQRLAKERGLNVHVISAGTDPEPNVAPAVADHLTKNGDVVPVSKPRRVTDDEISTADVVISIGCDLKGLPTPRGTLLNWDDVPALSEDFQRADERIRARVIQLVDELARKQQR